VEEVAGRIIPEIVDRLGLAYLDLTEKELRDVIEPIIEAIAEARSTKPTDESLIKRITGNKLLLYKAIAAKLAERDDLTPEQLEFVVSYAPEIAGRLAPKLYYIARSKGADHIVDALRYLWDKYGKPFPVRCPYCEFRSVAPDLTCIVCGRSVDEEDLKDYIGFRGLLARYAETAPRQIAAEIYRSGYVVYDGEIHPPSLKSRAPLGVVLYLSKEEKRLLAEILGLEEA